MEVAAEAGGQVELLAVLEHLQGGAIEQISMQRAMEQHSTAHDALGARMSFKGFLGLMGQQPWCQLLADKTKSALGPKSHLAAAAEAIAERVGPIQVMGRH